jgi:hypothetical protein
MWRTVILMAAYALWVFLYFALAFSIMYYPYWVQLPVLLGYVGLYGTLSYLWLTGRRARLISALIVPVPVLLFVVAAEYHSTGNAAFSLRWLTMLPIHAGGVFAAAMLGRRRVRTMHGA